MSEHDPSTLDLVNVGHRVFIWRTKNFGKPTAMRNALQICEEAGEVARAVGKSDEGIRPDTRGNLADELADVILAVAGFANQEKIDIYAALHRRLGRMERLDFTSDPEGGEAAKETVAPRSAAELISAERARQMGEEDWSAEHDDGHAYGILAKVAAAMLLHPTDFCVAESSGDLEPNSEPWEDPWGLVKKHGYNGTAPDEVKALTIAGALVAAELDRVLRRRTR